MKAFGRTVLEERSTRMELVQIKLAMAGLLFMERERGGSGVVGAAGVGRPELPYDRACIGRVLEAGEKLNDEEVEAKQSGRMHLGEITCALCRRACASQRCSLCIHYM